MSTFHKLDKIVLPSSVEFSQVSNGRVSPGISQMVERPAGHVHPMFTAIQEAKPQAEFTTTQIGTLLAACGVGGLSLTSASDLYLKKGAVTGSVARATTQHIRLRVQQGLFYWTSISLPHNGRGEASCVLRCGYDGTNNPIVHSASVALSGNLTANEYFGVGPLSINGTSIANIQSIEIASGITLLEAGGDSTHWDTILAISATEPIITIRTITATNWGTLGLNGVVLDGANGVKFYAKKFKASGARVANATAQHILFTGLNGTAQPVDSSGDTNSPITDTLRVQLVAANDSSLPLIGAVNSAII